jgi:heat-inducible transcriptional repressor
MHETINERSQHLLKVLIERYIRAGQPVGSRTLAEDTALSLSPATIRNVMAELEDLGYLRSPHTSAGRVPTAQAYRFFVNSLLTTQPLELAEAEQLQQQLSLEADTQTLVNTVSAWLSSVTKLTGLVTLPRLEIMQLRHVEFLPLSDKRVLVILVLNEHEVQNRIINTERVYTSSELQEAANYLNARYNGQDLREIKQQLLWAMQQDRAALDQLLHTTVDVAEKAFTDSQPATDYVLSGHSHLLDLAEATDGQRMRSLFEAFMDKRDIMHLLDQSLSAEGVQIFIGTESGHSVLEDCSLVTAPYQADGKAVGVLGVVGPTRIPYERVIAVVDVTAKLLGAALN